MSQLFLGDENSTKRRVYINSTVHFFISINKREIYIFYALNTNPDSLGTLNEIVDIEYKGILRYYLVSIIIIILISGILIARQSIRSEKLEIKLKGKFLLIAFILFVIGAFADAVLLLTVITLPIIRIILISSSVLFYFGFILPKF